MYRPVALPFWLSAWVACLLHRRAGTSSFAIGNGDGRALVYIRPAKGRSARRETSRNLAHRCLVRAAGRWDEGIWLHAVIDNFSRRVWAWCIAERFEIASSVSVLRSAVQDAMSCDAPPRLFADGGIETVNADVDGLGEEGMLRRVRALVTVTGWKSRRHWRRGEERRAAGG